jgi:hypothetical protein
MGRANDGGERRQATPLEIAKYGHIAARLRGLLDAGEWTIPMLSRAAGLKTAYAAWPWVYARAAPNNEAAAKLAKAIGCRARDLARKEVTDLAAIPADEPGHESTPVTTPPEPVFSFVVRSDGTVRLKLDTVLPLESAKPLLRMLFDAGDLLPGNDASLQPRIRPPARR